MLLLRPPQHVLDLWTPLIHVLVPFPRLWFKLSNEIKALASMLTFSNQQLYIRFLLAALCLQAYQQVKFSSFIQSVTERVLHVTHFVANCVKNVILIGSSVIFFPNTSLTIKALGNKIKLFLNISAL